MVGDEMTDYIIIGLLALLVLENSRYGIRAMNWLVVQFAHIRHAKNKLINALRGRK